MDKVSSLQELSIDYLLQNKVKMAFTGDDFAILDDFSKVPQFWGAHLNSFVMVFCIKGKLSFTFNNCCDQVDTHQFYVFQPGSVVTDIMMSTDFSGTVVFVTARLVQALLHHHIEIWNKVLYVHKINKFPIEDWNVEDVSYYGRTYRLLATNSDRPFTREIILSIIQTFLLEICSIFARDEQAIEKKNIKDEVHETSLQSHVFFQDFIDLLQHESPKHHSTGYYAQKLNISAKYLGAIVKKESGKTVKQWIMEYVNSDIHYYLLTTTYSIKEISTRMGFSSISFFGKYVKKHTGMSPRALRRAAQAGRSRTNDFFAQRQYEQISRQKS